MQKCRMARMRFNEDCAKEVMAELGIDESKVGQCMGYTGAGPGGVNPMLEGEQLAELDVEARGGISMIPTIVVNHQQV